jgi:hypothetical protein
MAEIGALGQFINLFVKSRPSPIAIISHRGAFDSIVCRAGRLNRTTHHIPFHWETKWSHTGRYAIAGERRVPHH